MAALETKKSSSPSIDRLRSALLVSVSAASSLNPSQTLEVAPPWAMKTARSLEANEMARGTVKWFNSQKGYGFIQPQGGGGKDVFVHISAVEKAGLPGLNEGQVVEYEEVSNRGKTSAENLKVSR
jgi:CspA family cold shock protein